MKRTLNILLLFVVVLTVGMVSYVDNIGGFYHWFIYNSPNTGASKLETCDEPRPRRLEMRPVDNGNHTYVFSAYMDVDKGESIVRVIGITIAKDTDRPPMWCIFWRHCLSQKVAAKVEKLPEDHDMRYTAAYITCDVNAAFGEPNHLAVVSASSNGTPNILTVEAATPRQERNFTMCLPPVHSNYDNLNQLLEYVIVNRLFGANLFVFYNNSMSARVSRALEMFVSQGLAEVVPWRIHQQVLQDVHYFAQLAATNDCMYRHRYQTLYIVSTDLDEFIVPRKSDSWMSMIQPVLKAFPSTAAYYARSYIYCTQRKDHSGNFSEKETALKYKIMSLLKTNRSVLALPPNIRQKYIFDPKRVKTLGIHIIWTPLPGFRHQFVDIGDGALNHYRDTSPGTYRPGVDETFITDTYMHSFQKDIADGLSAQWTRLESYTRINQV